MVPSSVSASGSALFRASASEGQMSKTGENHEPNPSQQPKEGNSNRNLEEEQRRQAKVLPFREKTDKKETDRKTKAK